jgi:hypothetical protein
MTTRYHLLTSAEAQIEAVSKAVCIAIIDESDPIRTEMENNWANFRAQFSQRPYFLLQVGSGTLNLGVPVNMQNDILNDPLTKAYIRSQSGLYSSPNLQLNFESYDNDPQAQFNYGDFMPESSGLGPGEGMTRDNGTTSLRTDIFAICELDQLQPGDNVFLFVDDSGSMSVSTIRATLDMFQSRCNAAGVNVFSVFNGQENYVLPFINFVGTPGVP